MGNLTGPYLGTVSRSIGWIVIRVHIGASISRYLHLLICCARSSQGTVVSPASLNWINSGDFKEGHGLQENKIPFESLLLGVTQKLELPPPMYGCTDVQQNITFVVIRIIAGCKGYYFQDKRRKCLLQSERDAAERATIYLARKFKIMVEDINSEKRDRFTRCASFYKAMTATLEGHGPAGVQLT